MVRLTVPRASRSRRFDPRLVIGVFVVVGSMTAGYLVVTSATHMSSVYVTRSTVLAGTALSETNLELVPANLADARGAYLAQGSLADGVIATRTIGAGEFVPLSVVGSASAVTSTRLVVDVSSGLPADTTPGTPVDVWATLSDPFGEVPSSSAIVVPGATFVRTVEGDSIASETAMRVELLIPRATLRSLLVAQGDGAHIVVVPTVSQVG